MPCARRRAGNRLEEDAREVEQARATVARLQAEVERARATLGDAQLKLRRARDLFAMELIPLSELDTAAANAVQAEAAVKAAEAQVTQARASLNQAEVNLGHTIIAAPIDGIVISRNVDVGQTVAASMQAPTLFVIARDLTQVERRSPHVKPSGSVVPVPGTYGVLAGASGAVIRNNPFLNSARVRPGSTG